MCKDLRRKMRLQCTTVVWLSGSCTNKRDKLRDTSIRILCNAKIFGFVHWHSILGWYGQPCHKQWNGEDYSHSILGWYGQLCHNEWNDEAFWQCFHLTYPVNTIKNTSNYRLRIIRLAKKTPWHMIKKVYIVTFIMQLKFYLLCIYYTDTVCVVQSTGVVQPQACATMLLASVQCSC